MLLEKSSVSCYKSVADFIKDVVHILCENAQFRVFIHDTWVPVFSQGISILDL